MTSFISVMREVNMANLGFYALFCGKGCYKFVDCHAVFKWLAMTGKQADFARRFLKQNLTLQRQFV